MAGIRNWRAPRRGLGQHYWNGRSSGVVITRDGMGAAPRMYRDYGTVSRVGRAFPKLTSLRGLGVPLGGAVVHPLGMALGGVVSYFIGRWAGKKWGKTDKSPKQWGLALAAASVGSSIVTNMRSTGSPIGTAPAEEPIAPVAAMTAQSPTIQAMTNGELIDAAALDFPTVAAPVTSQPNGNPPLPQDFFTHPGDTLAPLRSALFGLMQASAEFGGPPPEDQLVRFQTLIEEALPAARLSTDIQAASLVRDAEQAIRSIATQLDPDEGTGWYER